MTDYSGILGIAAILALSLFFSENRRLVSVRLIVIGLSLQIGGIGSLVPSRQQDLAKLALKAMLAATMANCLSGAVAGLLF